MFQSFDMTTNPANAKERVERLRYEMEKQNLDGFLVPRADEHQGEYVPPHAQRLAWLTGFTGSAGIALILKKSAILFVDGRYTLQVKQQTDPSIFDYCDLIATPPATWLTQNAAGLNIGFDPWLHTINDVKNLKKSLENQTDTHLIAVQKNLVDLVWDDQPEPPLSPVRLQPLAFAGVSTDEKLPLIQTDIAKHHCDLALLSDPSSIAWIFNIRGNDVSNTPFALSFALMPAHGRPMLFIDSRKLGNEQRDYLKNYSDIYSPDQLILHIQKQAKEHKCFALDPTLVGQKFAGEITEYGGKIKYVSDPAKLPRAIKNKSELDGSRNAHARDGIALCRFFAWLSRQPFGSVSEISAAKKLEEIRFQTALEQGSKLEDLSFDTISGTGPDGAIIHYRVTTPTNRILNEGDLYLVDSGAQYRDGTTDVTRTVAIGQVGDEEKRCFTLVLKGMIGISTAHFPQSTRGQDIDALARINLWKAGLDFAHGTGHGVGAYLAVHEGPQNLSKRGVQELFAGMIVSNEPGYYREGAFGIRIENLLAIKPAEQITGGDYPMLSFETLTYCPIDRDLINVNMLTEEERQWINAYHKEVFDRHSTYLNDEDKAWLKNVTQSI
ncbi:aminopeptidase P family protein [Bartonella tamiae]|uniref:Xaa-Pro aminopeptidase n=1 Tax=Bartonella tamiae Th239 TaxID=1094558 RepID=J1JVQ9_9HYPH|nr:aminopeptidase P family protein [Bartonella tamiae]EJF89052.1 hypothetical protein ME5_01603 [Bartonella tamiae Th239]EJF94698.1 hypothetical protein MEG_00279 [Bartonella tamiae Th307]